MEILIRVVFHGQVWEFSDLDLSMEIVHVRKFQVYIYIVYLVCTCLHKSCASYIIYIYIYYVYAYVHLAEKHVYTHAMQPAKQTEYIIYPIWLSVIVTHRDYHVTCFLEYKHGGMYVRA